MAQSLRQILYIAGLGVAAALVLRLLISRLFRIYRWFVVFLCYQIAQALVMLPFRQGKTLYGLIFVATEPVTWLLLVLVVLELYSLALGKHEGIASLSRWAMTGALLVAVGISAWTLAADLSRPARRFPVLVYYSVIERGVMSSLVLFLLLITVFLVWCPVAVRRNIVLHGAVCSAYFLSSALMLFVRNIVGYQANLTVSTMLVAIEDVCLLIWLAFLSRSGEEMVVVIRHKWRPEDQEQLMKQLDAINSVLLGQPRK